MSNSEESGTYVHWGAYIAFRSFEGSMWRLSRSIINPDTSVTIVYLDEFPHFWQVETKVKALLENDKLARIEQKARTT